MSLKTTPANSRQNVVNSPDNAGFKKAVKELKEENALVVKGEAAKKRVVKIVDTYVAGLKHGEKEAAREKLCKAAGIVYRTFQRWKAEIAQRFDIGPIIADKAEEMGYEITPSSIRALVDAKRLNPGKTPEEIVRKAMREDAATKAPTSATQEGPARFKEPDSTPPQLLADIICKYLQDTNDDVTDLVRVLKEQVPLNKLCAAIKGLCP